jgi:hypothetical protein
MTSCADPLVIEGPGQYRAAATAGQGDGGVLDCEGRSPMAAFQIDLAEASWVYLDTLDSDLDTVLSVHEEACDGKRRACATAGEPLLLPLGAGRYFIAVDGAGEGVVELRYQASPCSAQLLGPGSSFAQVGGCLGGDAGSCGGGPSTFCAAGVMEGVWVLAGGRVIQIDTCVGTFFDSVLYLRSGDCAGPEVACVNADSCGDGDDERLSGKLAPGMYFLFVDSANYWEAGYNVTFQ